MTRKNGNILEFLRKYWFIILTLVSISTGYSLLQYKVSEAQDAIASVERKCDQVTINKEHINIIKNDVGWIKNEMTEQKAAVKDIKQEMKEGFKDLAELIRHTNG